MTGKCFIDTNLLIYLSTNEAVKSNFIKEFIYKIENPVISTQVLLEYSNVMLKKYNFSSQKVEEILAGFKMAMNIAVINYQLIIKCLEIKDKYKFSFWDCLIIATALENNCIYLYSEDLQHNQFIENLKIINPFKI